MEERYIPLMPATAVRDGRELLQSTLRIVLPVVAIGGAAAVLALEPLSTGTVLLAVWLVVGTALTLRIGILAGKFRKGSVSMVDARIRGSELSLGVFQGYLRPRKWLAVPASSTVTVRTEGDSAPYALSVTTSAGVARVGSTLEWTRECHVRLTEIAMQAGVRVKG